MSTLAVATIKSASSAAPVFQNTSGTEIGQLAKAYVKINGVSGTFVRQEFGVSSVTDSGTGDYTVNFSTAFANDEFIIVCGATNNNHSRGGFGMKEGGSTTTCDLFCTSYSNNSRFDVEAYFAFYGD